MQEALAELYALGIQEDELSIVGHGDGATMAGREHIEIDTIGGVGWLLDLGRGFFQGRCRCRSDESSSGETQKGGNHIGSSFGHGLGFIDAQGITR
jgi:hypothetical protein